METFLKYIILTLAILSIALTFLLALLEIQKETKSYKKYIIILLIGIGIIGVTSIFLQQWKDNLDEAESNRKEIKVKELQYKILNNSDSIKTKQNTLLQQQNVLLLEQNKALSIATDLKGFSDGGLDNKPIITVDINKSNYGKYFVMLFIISNYGKYPLTNIGYEIYEDYTTEYNFMKLTRYKFSDVRDGGPNMEYNKYMIDHENENTQKGEILGLPAGAKKILFKGKLFLESRSAEVHITLLWNNQFYTAYYNYIRKGYSFDLYDLKVFDSSDKEVKDLSGFFPLVPQIFWKGNKNLNTNNTERNIPTVGRDSD